MSLYGSTKDSIAGFVDKSNDLKKRSHSSSVGHVTLTLEDTEVLEEQGWVVDKVELGKGEGEGERENDERDAEEDIMLRLRFFPINAMSLTGA